MYVSMYIRQQARAAAVPKFFFIHIKNKSFAYVLGLFILFCMPPSHPTHPPPTT